MKNHFLWIIIGLAIGLTHLFRYWIGELHGTDVFWHLPIIENIRYADYLIQKWFLVVVAFLIFGWWLKKQGTVVKTIRSNLPFIILIALVTLVVHAFSFQRWFEFDDYRVIGHHYAVEGTSREHQMGAGSSYYYGIGLVYLVVGWFNSNFELYNSLGLLIYFLSGVTIFFIAERLGANKFVSLLVALFFVTSSTYWREMLLMLELLGDGFKLLLFALSIFLLLSKFYPGAVIFAAAALEFGISRTHFIGLPLILMCILFKDRKEKNSEWVLSIAAFFVMSFLYIQVLGTHPPKVIDTTDWNNNWSQLLRVGDTIFGVTVPHAIAYTALSFTNWLTDNYNYSSSVLGVAIVALFATLSGILLKSKKMLSGKLIFLGIVIVAAAIFFPTLMGIRLNYKVDTLTAQYKDFIPTAPTSYGVFSTFGMIFILIGVSKFIKEGVFKKIVILLIILNAITVVKSDIAWAKMHSTPQRAINKQLNDFLPYDGRIKVIYTPAPTQVLSRYISYFYQLYRTRETVHFTNEPAEFIRLLVETKPSRERVYLLLLDIETNEIIDLSSRVREYYPDKELTPEILATFTE